jgi:hypothetical protein
LQDLAFLQRENSDDDEDDDGDDDEEGDGDDHVSDEQGNNVSGRMNGSSEPSTPQRSTATATNQKSPTSSAKKRVQFDLARVQVQEYYTKEKPADVAAVPSPTVDLAKKPSKGLLKVKNAPTPPASPNFATPLPGAL